MTTSSGATTPMALSCLSVSGSRAPLPLLETLSVGRDEHHDALLDLQRRSTASQLCLLSTCERTELYAIWAGEAAPDRLIQALAGNRGSSIEAVCHGGTLFSGHRAVRHLLRVTAGLESFVLGERDIVGQVRAAAEASQAQGLAGLEMQRLLATAVNTSRRVHAGTRLGEGCRSVAAAAVQLAAGQNGGNLDGRRLLVVGAGHVARELAESALRLGGDVTVCNRTRRHADRLVAAGAAVVDLGRLTQALTTADVAIFATAAPHRLVDGARLDSARAGRARPLLIIDLCVPRNVAPEVRGRSGVQLVDLADLRQMGASESELIEDVAEAEQIVEVELTRYSRWLAGRSAAASLCRLRKDVEACVRTQVQRATQDLPEDVRPFVEAGVRRAVHQLAHGPTQQLMAAAEAGDYELVDVLAGIFAPAAQGV